ncbi:NADPH-dependent FMN reductase [Nonomuraea sp. NPDC050556]|uniref:NADPH-dependent FMN reductase n=1 Tax=Nonomuraea sp. NPDC050556 TaxID=3364369 RepID=UPI0037B2AAE6
MRLLLVCGSLMAGSVNEAALRTATHVVPEGVETDLYRGLAALPHFNPDHDHDPLPHGVADLRARIALADALLFCTPEYAGALPGPFKNLLDWTVGGVEIGGKPTGWINVSTASTGALPAHDSLRRVLSYTGAKLVEEACAHLPLPRHLVGPDGLVTDPAFRRELALRLVALTA